MKIVSQIGHVFLKLRKAISRFKRRDIEWEKNTETG